MTVSDAVFLEQFENQTLLPKYFDHHGHLRLAWLYLRQYPLQTAIDKVSSGISKYANSLGATDKFHHTLTEATVRIMADRLALNCYPSFKDYLDDNTDLVNNLWGVIQSYYSQSRIESDEAKDTFLEPDLKPF